MLGFANTLMLAQLTYWAGVLPDLLTGAAE